MDVEYSGRSLMLRVLKSVQKHTIPSSCDCWIVSLCEVATPLAIVHKEMKITISMRPTALRKKALRTNKAGSRWWVQQWLPMQETGRIHVIGNWGSSSAKQTSLTQLWWGIMQAGYYQRRSKLYIKWFIRFLHPKRRSGVFVALHACLIYDASRWLFYHCFQIYINFTLDWSNPWSIRMELQIRRI